MSRLTARISPTHSVVIGLDDALLDLFQPLFQFVGFRTVVVHHRVDDAMEQRDRALRQDVVGALAQPGHMGDAAAQAVVDGDQVVRAEEEIRFVGVEEVLLALEVDAVQDQVEVMPVRLDLGVGLPA